MNIHDKSTGETKVIDIGDAATIPWEQLEGAAQRRLRLLGFPELQACERLAVRYTTC